MRWATSTAVRSRTDGTNCRWPGWVGPVFAARVAVVLLLAGAGLACKEPTPTIPHGLPNEAAAQMCVVCHTCGNDGSALQEAPLIDQAHDVCNSCHLPDGTVVHNAGDSCAWEMNCDDEPPTINCNQCHTVEYVNDLCEECHHLP